MARRSKENAIDWDAIRKGYEVDGISMRRLAAMYGCQLSSVTRKAKFSGWVPPNVPHEDELSPASAGFVYVIGFVDSRASGFFKIGLTSNVQARLAALQTAMPFDLKVAASYWVENMLHEERLLHASFSHKRVRGEWFELDRGDLDSIAKRSLLL